MTDSLAPSVKASQPDIELLGKPAAAWKTGLTKVVALLGGAGSVVSIGMGAAALVTGKKLPTILIPNWLRV